MSEHIIQILGTIAVAMLAALPGLLAYRYQRRRSDAESEATLSAEARALMQQYRERNQELEARVAKLEEQIAQMAERLALLEGENGALRVGVNRLIWQVRELGHTPVWSVD